MKMNERVRARGMTLQGHREVEIEGDLEIL